MSRLEVRKVLKSVSRQDYSYFVVVITHQQWSFEEWGRGQCLRLDDVVWSVELDFLCSGGTEIEIFY